MRYTLSFALLIISLLANAQNVSDYYQIETINIPKEIKLEVGGLAFNDAGQLAVCTRRGEVWLILDPTSENPSYKRFAHGLHEALGINFRNGVYYVTQRSELTRLQDTNGDLVADVYETVYSWDLSGNYHEYSYGPEFLPNGDMIVTLNLAWQGGGKSFVKWRGWMLRITPDGKLYPHATGMRSPAGFGINAENDIFYAENQGDWVGSGRVTHVEVGDFVGHPEGLKWTDDRLSPLKLKPENISDDYGLTMYQYAKLVPEIKPPSVWFPHGLMGISTSDIKMIPEGFGPFTGQMFVGDQGHSKIMRMSQEKVNGVYQGACFPFVEGFSSGVLRLRWDNNPSLYVGMTSRGWSSVGRAMFGLQRLRWTGLTPFEIKHISARPDGFELEFTEVVDEKSARDITSYQLSDFTYQYHQAYGSPVINKENREIASVVLSEDGLKARISIDKLRRGYIYEIKAPGVRNRQNQPLLHDFAYYTLNEIPKGSARVFENNQQVVASKAVLTTNKRITVKPASWKQDEIKTIEISTIPGLKFDQDRITVSAGDKVKLTFSNPDDMLHNFLVVKPNTVDEVVSQALKLGLDGQEMNYVPLSPDVLFHTNLLQPETSESIYFQVPNQPGTYAYVCTFPGHGQVMRGVLKVLAKGTSS